MDDRDPPPCPQCQRPTQRQAEVPDDDAPVGTRMFAYRCPECECIWEDHLDGAEMVKRFVRDPD